MRLLSAPLPLGLGFGCWRALLAFFVAISHLWKPMIGGPAAYAVWGFFVLSGFLMTHVVRTKYGWTPGGLRDYAWNRFLRIFPGYWLALLLGVLAVVLLPLPPEAALTHLNPQFGLPPKLRDWAFPLTLFPAFHTPLMPVPVAAALGTEVGVYLLIPLLARSASTAWLALLVGIGANVDLGFETTTFSLRYTQFGTCLLPFAVGSLVCHHRDRLQAWVQPLPAVACWLLHAGAIELRRLWPPCDKWPWTYGLYASVLLSAWVVVSLAATRPSRLDNALGDLSYPIYLFHTLAAAPWLLVFGGERPLPFFLVGLASTLALSWVFLVVLDRPLMRKKKRQPVLTADAAPS